MDKGRILIDCWEKPQDKDYYLLFIRNDGATKYDKVR